MLTPPFHDAALKSLPLRVVARQSAAMLGNAGPLIVEFAPRLGIPDRRASEQANQLGLTLAEFLNQLVR